MNDWFLRKQFPSLPAADLSGEALITPLRVRTGGSQLVGQWAWHEAERSMSKAHAIGRGGVEQ